MSNPRSFWLNAFSVDPAYRKQGIGKSLLSEAMSAAVKKNGEVVKLITLGNHSKGRPIMAAARKMYEKEGFSVFKEEQVNYGKDSKISVFWYQK